jgi:hypothetical protein
MDRFAILLDAGYFFAAGASVIAGQQVPRKQISLKDPGAAAFDLAVAAAAAVQTNVNCLLRTYWYDAVPGARPSLEQSSIAMLPYVKVRFGVLNSAGEQKGVDSLIVTDLIELARNRALSDAVIVSGDEDLRVAVQVAQSFGVRVHILAAGDPRGNVSSSLQMEADSVASLDRAWFTKHFAVAQPAPQPVASPTVVVLAPSGPKVYAAAQSVDDAAVKVCAELLGSAQKPQVVALQEHFAKSSSVPPDFDRRLIAKVAADVGGRKLTGDEMRHVRGVFVKSVRSFPTQ